MIKEFFKRLLQWIGTAFSGSDNVSIKRICGFLMVIVVLNILYLVGFKVIEVKIWIVIQPFCNTLLLTASVYFGVNAIIDIAKLIKGGSE